MKSRTKKILQLIFLTLTFGFTFLETMFAQTTQNWQLAIPTKLQGEEAVKVVLNDLKTLAKELDIAFNITDDQVPIKNRAIIVGSPTLNKSTAELQKNSEFLLKGVNDEQGYEVITKKNE